MEDEEGTRQSRPAWRPLFFPRLRSSRLAWSILFIDPEVTAAALELTLVLLLEYTLAVLLTVGRSPSAKSAWRGRWSDAPPGTAGGACDGPGGWRATAGLEGPVV